MAPETESNHCTAGGHTVSPVGYASVAEAFLERAGQNPDGLALSYFGRTFSWGEIEAITARLGGALQARGVQAGDRILVQLQNQPEFVFAALAAWRIGAVIVPASPMYSAREIRRLITDSQPVVYLGSRGVWASQGAASVSDTSVRLVITSGIDDYAAKVPQVFSGVDDSAVASGEPGGVELVDFRAAVAETRPLTPVTVAPRDIAILEYTSGTTGAPKAGIEQHSGVLWVGTSYTAAHEVLDATEVLLAVAPLSHITGQSAHLGAWLVSGARLVLGYRFQASYFLDLFRDERVTWTTGAATVYIGLLDEMERRPTALPELKLLGCGGAPVPTELALRIRDAFGVPFRPGYGLTETTGPCVHYTGDETPPVDPESGIISVGKPLFDCRVRVVGEDGATLSWGTRGEILVSGPSVNPGYWRNDEETAQTFVDGWLHTGDVGFIDAEENLYVVDRTKNVIIASGYKVWPREVEDVLYQIESIREVAVVGVPDPYRGETVVAVVSLHEGQELDTDKALAHCRENLATYKVPRRIEIVDEVAKNFNGKIVHGDVRAEVIARQA